MISEKSPNLNHTDVEHVISFIRAAQKSVIYIRQYPDQNSTVDISTLGSNDHDNDHPDPLRVPEVIIVISVLLLWCGSIFIFIRHSELLRIRHRDIPYNSSLKSSINLNHVTVANHRASDINIQTKSQVSSIGGLTPPMNNHIYRGCKYSEAIETISLKISPVLHKRRHTHSFDFHASSSPTRYLLEKNNDKVHLLHPYRILSDTKQSSYVHPKSADNLKRKSIDNLSAMKYSTCYSANDILRGQRINDNANHPMGKKRCTQESPV